MVDYLAKRSEKPAFCFFLLSLACAGTVIVPVWITGLHATGDLGVILGFGQEIQNALSRGDLLPGWANDNAGFGSVGIRFYPPITFYLLGILGFAGIGWYSAVLISLLFWAMVGTFGIYLFVREWGTGTQGLIAGLVYTVMPFHLAEIFQFSLYAEFAAGAFFVLSLLFATRIIGHSKWNDVLWLSLCLAGLILTHIPTSVIGVASLGVYLMFLLGRNIADSGRAVIQLSAATLLALSISSFYWIKVVTELDWVAHAEEKYATSVTSFLIPYDWKQIEMEHYFPLYRNLTAIFLFGALMLGPFILLRFGKSYKNSGNRGVIMSVSATSIVGLLMISRVSSYVWEYSPLLAKIQFPWRWLGVITILLTISFVLSLGKLITYHPRYKTLFLAVAAVFLVAVLAYDLRQNFARPNVISNSGFTEALNAKDSQRDTTFAAWWPIWARGEALDDPNRVTAGSRDVEISKWDPLQRRFHIAAGNPVEVCVATFYYPHWKATANGVAVSIKPDRNGLIVIGVDANATDIDLRFEEPTLVRISVILSCAAALFLLVCLLRRRKMDRKAGDQPLHFSPNGKV